MADEAKHRTMDPQAARLAPRREDYPNEEAFEEAKAYHRHRTRPSKASRAA